MRNMIVKHTYIEPYYAGMGPSKTRYSKKLRNSYINHKRAVHRDNRPSPRTCYKYYCER